MAIRSPRIVARRRAIRSLFERGTPTAELADLLGIKEKTILARARKGAWQVEKPTTREEAAERIARQMDGLLRAIDAAGGRPDKGEIDALVARMRLLEKLSEINEGRQSRQEEQKKTDAEIAEILGRIDARILELAREFAAQLVRDRDTEAAGRPDRQ